MPRVELAVYDLSRGMAATMSQQILGQRIDGIWHTGIVVFGKEWFFGGGIQCLPLGAFAAQNNIQMSQLLFLGETVKTERELQAFLSTIRNQFTMMAYDLINNNCNNFSDTLSRFLINSGIPSYIVDLPRIVFSTPGGQMLRPMIESMQQGIRHQNGGSLDPFNLSASNGFESSDPSSLSPSPVINFMSMIQPPAVVRNAVTKLCFDTKPLVSDDRSSVDVLGKKLVNLKSKENLTTDGQTVTILNENDKEKIEKMLVLLKESTNNVFSNTDVEFLLELSEKPFPTQMYLVFLLRLVVLGVEYLSQTKSDSISSLNTLVQRLKVSSLNLQSEVEIFFSIPAKVMALSTLANYLTTATGKICLLDSTLSVGTDLVDVAMSGLSHVRLEVRQMSAAVAYNATLCLITERSSTLSSYEITINTEDLQSKLTQIICGCLDSVDTETDAVTRLRRLRTIALIIFFGKQSQTEGSGLLEIVMLVKDLGLESVLQLIKTNLTEQQKLAPMKAEELKAENDVVKDLITLIS